MDQSALRCFAQQKGLFLNYLDAWGKNQDISDETLINLLQLQGYSLPEDESELLREAPQAQSTVINPVIVCRENRPIQITLNLTASSRISDFSWHLCTEQGQQYSGEVKASLIDQACTEKTAASFTIPHSLDLGYHHLEIRRKRRKATYESCLILAPECSYQTQAQIQGKKMWGTSIQLYGIKSHKNWGVGDFGDLKVLIEQTANQGADFVGLNPLHALFPAYPENRSPYSPSSRSQLNMIYIDVPAVAEFAEVKEAQQLVQTAAFQLKLQQLRETQWVDYRGVTALKLQVLNLLYRAFQSEDNQESARMQQFKAFIEQGGETLQNQASFDALHAYLCQQDSDIHSAATFPPAYHDIKGEAVQTFIAAHQYEIQFYCYLQWLADAQLAQAQNLAKMCGMQIGIYQDLAVGVDHGGADVWGNPTAYSHDASIGAPPDVLAPMGQNWGLTTFMPDELQQHAYGQFIDLLRANMQSCGALRIDHILGLMRLWWIPTRQASGEGGYIQYPHQDLLSIIALESHRTKCVVIGEDLGTVPDQFKQALSQSGIFTYKVFLYSTSADGGYYSPDHYEENSLAAVCTHDMPTLIGFWHCEDLKLGERLALYPSQQTVEELSKGRLSNKQNILNSLHWHGVLSESVGSDAVWVPMDSELNEAIHVHLAKGKSSLMTVQLEDCLAMDQPVNVPGTFNEYPNWQRKLTQNIEDIFTSPEVSRLFTSVNQSRKTVSLDDCFEPASLCK